MEDVDILIKNANELLTLQGSKDPRIGNDMQNLSMIQHGSVAIKENLIVAVGADLKVNAETVIDATDKVVLPGFVDPHTHLVFAGSREFELDMKLHGKTYMEILAEGGGIHYTVEKTRKASDLLLKNEAVKRLDTMLYHGTTSIEAKTGYGLDTETEIRTLKLQRKLNKTHAIDIVSTFLGAHATPKEQTIEAYISEILDNMLPQTKGLADFCDVFCEKDVFSVDQAKKILTEAKQYGLIPKLHAEEIVNTGGATLAAEIGAISADHLLMVSDKGIRDMAEAKVIGVLLPGTPFCLMMDSYAPARKLIQGKVPVALATDLNPNCWTENMQFMIQLACFNMHMTPAEAITAATYNAACAIKKQDRIGSIEVGKQADIIIMDCKNHMMIPYQFGKNHVETVIKNGKIF